MRKKMLRLSACMALGVVGTILAGAGAGGANVSLAPITLTPPVITNAVPTNATIHLTICGTGDHGAPFGFSLQWMKLTDTNGDGVIDERDCAGFVWPLSDTPCDPGPCICKASFSGAPWCSAYNLTGSSGRNPCTGAGPNNCQTVVVGNLSDDVCGVGLSNCGADELECDTWYVFRLFSHAGTCGRQQFRRSAFSPNYCFKTLRGGPLCPEGGCVFSQGYWKNHPEEWCSDSLTICGMTYSKAVLLNCLNTPGQGDAVLIFWHQLIAAALNQQCNGAVAPICGDVCALATAYPLNPATGLPMTPCPGGPSACPDRNALLSAGGCLELYNTGAGGVPHCP